MSIVICYNLPLYLFQEYLLVYLLENLDILFKYQEVKHLVGNNSTIEMFLL